MKALELLIKNIYSAQEKASVIAKRNGARSVRRQGEHNEVQWLLLRAVPEVTEWMECSDNFRINDWNEVTGGTGNNTYLDI